MYRGWKKLHQLGKTVLGFGWMSTGWEKLFLGKNFG
jgi:hypothetical protein